MKDYTLMSYNIQSCKDYITKEFNPYIVSKVIKHFNPDIVGLNEVSGTNGLLENDPRWFNQIITLAEIIGYQYYFFAPAIELPKGPYGNGILSKYPLSNIEIFHIPDPLIKDEDAYYESRCILKCDIEDFTILITHLGLAKKEQENGYHTLIDIISKIKKPLILMGDFNMTPDNALIINLSSLLTDTSIMFKEPLKSYPSINESVKIDYLFVSKDFTIISSDIPKVVASDHFPYLVKVRK